MTVWSQLFFGKLTPASEDDAVVGGTLVGAPP